VSSTSYKLWGSVGEDFDAASLSQLQAAARLPIAVAGALMPDAHVGYGLPIGGVLATRGAVIPYAVGVDIACRMKLSVLDLPVSDLSQAARMDRLERAIESETRFGVGVGFDLKQRREHAVMEEDWSVSHVTRSGKDKAWAQLGTSGSGNHFVEFGLLTVMDGAPRHVAQSHVGGSHARWNLEPGQYVALLSHSGSRGTGAAVCDFYSKVAMDLHAGLNKDQKHLGWLDLASQAGAEYWGAMELMGQYAAANHACIHRAIAKNLGAEVLADVENHHNFAWKETHDVVDSDGVNRREELIVHRKGATPAAAGVMGVIPGSLATPGFVVVGKGGVGSLNSASHGAGRVMSRNKARETFRWGTARKEIEAAGVRVISCGVDEVPGVYKDIHRVMAMQQDLVEIVARFDPKLVKMAPEGERAED
jgi:tRNA-splicing ligase RtcB